MKTIYTILYEDKVSTWGEMYDALYKEDGKPLTFPDDDQCEAFMRRTFLCLGPGEYCDKEGRSVFVWHAPTWAVEKICHNCSLDLNVE